MMVGIEAEKRVESHHTTKPPVSPGAALRAKRESARVAAAPRRRPVPGGGQSPV
jgi:hypothetical protein